MHASSFVYSFDWKETNKQQKKDHFLPASCNVLKFASVKNFSKNRLVLIHFPDINHNGLLLSLSLSLSLTHTHTHTHTGTHTHTRRRSFEVVVVTDGRADMLRESIVQFQKEKETSMITSHGPDLKSDREDHQIWNDCPHQRTCLCHRGPALGVSSITYRTVPAVRVQNYSA